MNRVAGICLGVAMLTAGAGTPAGAAQPAAASVRPGPANPETELKIFSGDKVKVAWSGEGNSSSVIDLCVASTTGRFRLLVTSQSGGAMTGPNKLGYQIHFRDGSGAEQTQRVTGAQVTFDGSSGSAVNCDQGANATLEIISAERDIWGVAAGEYFDRLIVSATPL